MVTPIDVDMLIFDFTQESVIFSPVCGPSLLVIFLERNSSTTKKRIIKKHKSFPLYIRLHVIND